MNKKPRILLFDFETFPILGFAWRNYKTDLLRIVRDSIICCVSYTWLDDDEIYTISLPEFKRYEHNHFDDKPLIGAFLKVFNRADIVVAHNGKSFDWKMMNTRMVVHGFKPHNNPKIVDTLREARKYFRFTSNKQDEISRQLHNSRKEEKPDVFKCMDGDMKEWQKMIKYSKGDIRGLKPNYLSILPWIDNHPNYNLYNAEGQPRRCKNCGGTTLVKFGIIYLVSGVYQRYACKTCGFSRNRGERQDFKVPIK